MKGHNLQKSDNSHEIATKNVENPTKMQDKRCNSTTPPQCCNNTTPWRPIKTAPKDGTRILAYKYEKYGENFNILWWDEFMNNDLKKCWRSVSMHGYVPTHWKPLDAPPEVKK